MLAHLFWFSVYEIAARLQVKSRAGLSKQDSPHIPAARGSERVISRILGNMFPESEFGFLMPLLAGGEAHLRNYQYWNTGPALQNDFIKWFCYLKLYMPQRLLSL
jgi:hypothetical protein